METVQKYLNFNKKLDCNVHFAIFDLISDLFAELALMSWHWMDVSAIVYF